MAVIFKIMFTTEEECLHAGNKLHNSLAGSAAYINNDVILNIDFPPLLCLSAGAENANDIEVHINGEDLKFKQPM